MRDRAAGKGSLSMASDGCRGNTRPRGDQPASGLMLLENHGKFTALLEDFIG